MGPTTVELVIAVTAVPGSTKACQTNGDAATFAHLAAYYSAVEDAARRVDGRVIKVMGDATLLTFPIDRCREAVEALREFQTDASEMWRRFDSRCHVQVKISAGTVVCGELGPPGDARFDIVGNALNELFKAPWGDFELTSAVQALIG